MSAHLRPLPTLEERWLTPADLTTPTLLLRRISPAGGRPVLLVHGLSAQSNTFEINEAPGGDLARALVARGATVWLLDYRGSSRPEVLARLRIAAEAAPDAFRGRAAAEHDIGRAICEVADASPGYPRVDVVAHCVGAGLTALALLVDPTLPVGGLVLSTLGVFYRAPLVRQVMIGGHLAEYFRADAPDLWLDPWLDWSTGGRAYRRLHAAEAVWRRIGVGRLLPRPAGTEHFMRLSFIFGEPYAPSRVPSLDADRATVAAAFGPLSTPLMQDIAGWQRAGHVTGCHDSGPDGIPDGTPDGIPNGIAVDAMPFIERDVTLLTGRHNRLWHPDSMRTMHGWLLDHGADPRRLSHRVLPGYAHQDLLWGPNAARDVYPLIEQGLGLGPPGRAAR